MNAKRVLPLNDVLLSADLWEGDVLLFRGTGWLSWLIGRAGESPYTHAAMVSWRSDGHGDWQPYCLETREWIGGRAVTLRSQVDRYPGQIDVYRVKTMARPVSGSLRPATAYMWEATGRDYGWWEVFYAALRHLPFWRWTIEPDVNDDTPRDSLPFCSQLVDRALREVGIDLCPNQSDRITEPGDLSRSALLEYRYTLGGLK